LKLKITSDLIEEVWEERPELPSEKVYDHEIKYAGKTRGQKLLEVREVMKTYNVDYFLVSKLDDIAWLMNMRGTDINLNPVFISYVIIEQNETFLFVDESKVDGELKEELLKDSISLIPYQEVNSFLEKIQSDKTVLVNQVTTSISTNEAISNAKIVNGPLITTNLKGIKNATEIEHFKKVMAKDGAALTQAFCWLEETVKERTVTEYEYAAKLAECRGRQNTYKGESFDES